MEMFGNEYLIGQMSHQVQADRVKQAEQARLVRLITAARRARRQK